MDRFTLEQRCEILKNHVQSECCVAETVRKLRTIFGRNEAPSAPGFVKLACLWITEVIHVLVRCAQLKELLLLPKVCVKTQETSTRHRAQQLNVSRTSLRSILHRDLRLFDYKLQLTQESIEDSL
ncbi:hypothetical protein NQ318_009208 [Aromia moschata]|uniref:DUF4817 domain-containing protein n=1 Tax=Aromia moschata TaxID=1265417 RepID=A0AAV8XUQ4_9CUCU|nr:hypothetical protein NQ318_009208 [Aromia moschata]